MKLHYLSNSLLPSREANAVHVMKMCAAFAELGHDVTLHARDGRAGEGKSDLFSEYGVNPSFRISRLPATLSGLGKFRFAFHSARSAVRAGADLAYGRNAYALLVAAAHGMAVVYEAHAPPESTVRRMVEARLFRMRRFMRLVVVSNALAREYRRLFPWLAAITVAHDAADAPIEATVTSRSANGRLRVGYVGQLYPGKGMEVVVPLALAMPDVDFEVVGGEELWIRHWTAVGTAPNLRFVGFLPHAEAARRLSSYDLLLAPYQLSVTVARGGPDVVRWMSPLKLFEYMAAGRAIIASDLPVLREILTDGETALLVPPDDVGAWERAVRRLSDPDLRDHMARAGLRKLRTEHTWARRAAATVDSIAIEGAQ